MTELIFKRRHHGSSLLKATLLACIIFSCCSAPALTLYRDTFETYPVQNPAPNPLTNGPAGGQWFFVDLDGNTTTNEHRIWDSTTLGAGLNSRVWVTLTNGARLTNAISLSKLPPGDSHTLKLSFVVATDTLVVDRNTAFEYDVRTTQSALTFVSGGNADASQTFTGASGFGIASAGVKGKSPDRVFQLTFQASGLTASGNLLFSLARITNNAGAALNFFLDDVELLLDESTNAPIVLAAEPVLSLQHARITFSEPLDPASATNTANYTVAGLGVVNAWMLDARSVEIQTAAQAPGVLYSVQVANVKGANGTTVPTSLVSFRAPTLGMAAVKYDAGTAVSRPSGPPDPTSPEGYDWTVNVNTKPGMTTAPIANDIGGLNAWQITDDNSVGSGANAGGSIVYATGIDPVSDALARTNGWLLSVRMRYSTNFSSTAADQIMLYGDPLMGNRGGVFLGINTNGLFATLLGGGGTVSGNSYQLTDLAGATNAYHTHLLAYEPARGRLSYYFDGRLVVADFSMQVVANVNGVQFGCANSAGKGQANYNLVQFDVVNAQAPVIVQQPQSSTNGVGQTVTFSAAVTPWVNAYQWLSNDVPIVGATGSNYTTGFITLDNSGDQYKLRIFSGFGNLDSLPATLWVTDDTNAPTIVALSAVPTMDRVRITFSEPVLPEFATDPANYTWVTPGVSTLSVVVIDPFTVELQVTGLVAGSSYAVQVSNVRDTSNLPIASNSPGSFKTPQLQVLARYYAGTPQDTPAGPPDPVSVAGGSWSHTFTIVDGIATNAVFDDGGWHAWQIVDTQTSASGNFNHYSFPLSTADHAAARRFGWVMTVRAKVIDANTSGASALFAQYEDDLFFRNILNLAFDTAADLRVGLSRTNGFDYHSVTSGGIGFFDYHLHQVAYDPVSQFASYYFDGNLIEAKWSPSYIGPNSVAAPFWGAAGSAQIGTANFNLFELSVVAGPTASISLNGANVEVSYRGVLDATAQLSPASWAPVATNLNTTPAVLTVPAAGSSPMFFRAREP